jgi:site-specific DNA recombinase
VATVTIAAGYVRVSTEEQAYERFSIRAQREKIIALCNMHGWTLHDIYCDSGISGASLDRPELSRLLKDARDRRFDLVLVWKVDRLSRKVAHLAHLIETLQSLDIAFRSITEPFDTTNPTGKAFLQMLSVFAELEREVIRERSSLGIQKRIRQGLAHGRAPFGYIITDGRLEIEAEEAKIVRFLYEHYLQGVGSFRLANMLKAGCIPGLPEEVLRSQFAEAHLPAVRKRVMDILRNPAYAGYAKVQGGLCPMHHEAIVPVSIWEKAQQTRIHRTKSRQQEARPWMLSGRVYCGVCGSLMTGHRQKNRFRTATERPFYEYYICKNYFQNLGTYRQCNAGMVARHTVEGRVLDVIREIAAKGISHIEAARPVINRASPESANNVRQMKAALARLERARQKHITAFESGQAVDLALARNIADLTMTIEDLKKRISRLALQDSPSVAENLSISRHLADLPGIMRDADENQLREIVQTFVKRVIVTPTKEHRRGNRIKRIDIELFPL